MVLILIYILGMVGLALWFDHPDNWCFYFTDRIILMVLWPGIILLLLLLAVPITILTRCTGD